MAFETINNTDRLEPTSRDKVNNNFAKCLEKTNNLSDVTTPNDALNNLLPEQSVGTSGQVLTSDGEDAFWDTPNVMTYNNGSTTRDLTASSGTVNVAHGLGKTPKRVVIKTIVSSSIVGDGIYSNGKFISRYWSAVGAGVSNTLYVYTGAGTGQSLSISVDETNIIFSWTKEGSPSGTVYILWEVE